jgi:acetyltransferase-like isoleucine patch superfamily enzyme/acyl carrier protein
MNTPERSSLLDRLLRSLDRDRSLPTAHLARKALRFGAAKALAPIHLLACDRVGPGARAQGRPVIHNAGRIVIGARANLCSTFAPVQIRAARGGHVALGDDVMINFGTTISAETEVVLGDRVAVGPWVVLDDAAGERDPKPIRVGNDVWLAARVRVRPGAVIGDGAVIMAGSEVVGEIPPRAVAGGVPARVLRTLPEGDASPREIAAPVVSDGNGEMRASLRDLVLAASYRLARLALRGADHVGERPQVHGLPFVENLGHLWIGDDLSLSASPVRSHLVTGPSGVLRIGDGVTIGAGAAIAAQDRVEIGDGARLDPFVMLLGGDFHSAEDRAAAGASSPIVIGAHAFLGERVVVLHGANIGAHARIEPGSVVTGFIPEGAVAAGVPALVIHDPAAAPRSVSPPPARAADGVRPAIEHALRDVAPEADVAALPPQANLRIELDVDSMDFLRFVAALHRELGVDIPEVDYPALATLASCQTYLTARLSGGAPS